MQGQNADIKNNTIHHYAEHSKIYFEHPTQLTQNQDRETDCSFYTARDRSSIKSIKDANHNAKKHEARNELLNAREKSFLAVEEDVMTKYRPQQQPPHGKLRQNNHATPRPQGKPTEARQPYQH